MEPTQHTASQNAPLTVGHTPQQPASEPIPLPSQGTLTVIDGPGGTGKTLTLLELLVSLRHRSRTGENLRLAIATTRRLALTLFADDNAPDPAHHPSLEIIDTAALAADDPATTAERLSRLCRMLGTTHLIVHPLDALFAEHVREGVVHLAQLAWESSIAVVAVIPSTTPRGGPGIGQWFPNGNCPTIEDATRRRFLIPAPARGLAAIAADAFLLSQLEEGEAPETEILWRARLAGIEPTELSHAKRRLGVRDVMRRTKGCRHRAWRMGA